jgi:DNA-directed RNA polymerase subunit RPC12/RpoP
MSYADNAWYDANRESAEYANRDILEEQRKSKVHVTKAMIESFSDLLASYKSEYEGTPECEEKGPIYDEILKKMGGFPAWEPVYKPKEKQQTQSSAPLNEEKNQQPENLVVTTDEVINNGFDELVKAFRSDFGITGPWKNRGPTLKKLLRNIKEKSLVKCQYCTDFVTASDLEEGRCSKCRKNKHFGYCLSCGDEYHYWHDSDTEHRYTCPNCS